MSSVYCDWLRFLNFWQDPFGGNPHCSTLKFFSKFISHLYFYLSWKFHLPNLSVEKVRILDNMFGGDLYCTTPSLSYSIVLLYQPTLKIWCVFFERIKSLNLGGLILGGSPILVHPNFVVFCCVVTLTYCENFKCLAWVIKKFKFCRTHSGGPAYWGTQKFVIFHLFVILTKTENFSCLLWVVKKFEFCGPFGGASHFGTPKVWQILSFILTYPKNFMCLA